MIRCKIVIAGAAPGRHRGVCRCFAAGSSRRVRPRFGQGQRPDRGRRQQAIACQVHAEYQSLGPKERTQGCARRARSDLLQQGPGVRLHLLGESLPLGLQAALLEGIMIRGKVAIAGAVLGRPCCWRRRCRAGTGGNLRAGDREGTCRGSGYGDHQGIDQAHAARRQPQGQDQEQFDQLPERTAGWLRVHDLGGRLPMKSLLSGGGDTMVTCKK